MSPDGGMLIAAAGGAAAIGAAITLMHKMTELPPSSETKTTRLVEHRDSDGNLTKSVTTVTTKES